MSYGFSVNPAYMAELAEIVELQFSGPCPLCGKPLDVLKTNFQDKTHEACFEEWQRQEDAEARAEADRRWDAGMEDKGDWSR